MKRPGIKACMIVFAAVFLAAVSFGVYHASTCRAGAAEGFLPEKWWPSKYGPEDNRGANNLITPEVIMSGLKSSQDRQNLQACLTLYQSHAASVGTHL